MISTARFSLDRSTMSKQRQQDRSAIEKLARRVKVFTSEPLFYAIYLALIWIGAKLRSTIYSKLLNAPGLNMGPDCAVRGMRRISIGRSVSVYGGLWLEAVENYRGQSFSPRIYIGDRVSFSKDVHITCIEHITIGNDVLFGSRVYVSDHNHGRYAGVQQSHPDEPPAERALSPGGQVIIESNVWIGDNVVIVGPTRIGTGVIVAANSVVKGDIPPFIMIAGAPAKTIKKFDLELKIWRRI
jgi:acetyltransferase-like isoleucine patch superfamily enzyme